MSGSTGCPLLACFGIFAAWGVESAGAEFHHHWHQWRGPEADGVAPHGDPPLEWSEDKNVRWKVEIPGKGSATPIVWKDRVIVLTSIETDRKAEGAAPSREGGRRGGGGFGGGPVPENLHQFVVLCLDRDTGKTLWRHVAAEELPHEGLHSTNTYASGSPITDGESIFASFGSRGIYCLDMDGKQRWKRDLGDMQTRNGFGEGGSPALHGDTLVVNWDHEGQSFIAALDGRSGETRWQVDRDERTT
jgi:outer membrane protein assembly factor BamB